MDIRYNFGGPNREKMNVSFTDKQLKYIAKMVKSGDFQNASEVVRDAIRMHAVFQVKLSELRLEVQKGVESADSEKGVKDIIKDKRAQYDRRYGKAI